MRIEQQEGALQMAWRELDGPPVGDSNAGGFGSLLISDALGTMGRVEMRYPRTGAECDIVIED